MPAQRCEQSIDFLVVGDVAGKNQVGSEFTRQADDSILDSFPLIGECELCSLAMHGFCYAICDRAIAQHASDEDLLAAEKPHASP